ncbi:MAG TPA: hypothetical protein VF862_01045 [Gemmatimonadales bacterium]
MSGLANPADGPAAANRSFHSRGAWGLLVAMGAVAGLVGDGPGPAVATAQQPIPSPSCCRELHYLYEASILKIDAMRLQVRVDETTASAVGVLIGSAARSTRLDQEVARRYQDAREATFDMEFLVGVSGETFVSNTVKAIRELGRDGTLTEAEANRFGREAAERFEFLNTARVRSGDRLQYRVVADTVTTTYRRGETVLKVDRQVDTRARDVILATYFAPSSDFRKGLLNDVFRR